ncbi:MAG: hypothetical protein NTX05_02615 [Fusobacteria bacterium]|nr:hypothetical protein [Fusobacteriota bacterium]
MKKSLILSTSIILCAAAFSQNTINQVNTFGYTFYNQGLHTVDAMQTIASTAPNKSAYNMTALQSNVSYGFDNGWTVFSTVQFGRSSSTNKETVGLVGVPGVIALSNPCINSSELSTGLQFSITPELKTGIMVGYINLQNTPSTPLSAVGTSYTGTIQFKAVGFEFNTYIKYTPGKSIYAISMYYNSIFTSINPQYAYKLTPETTVGVYGAAQITNPNFQSLAGLYSQSITNNNLFFMENSLDMLSIKPGITYTPAALKGALQFSVFGGVDAFNYRSCAQVNTDSVTSRPYEEYLLITPQVNLTLPIGQNFFFNAMIQFDAYNAINGVSNLDYQAYYTFDKAFHMDANTSVALGYYF